MGFADISNPNAVRGAVAEGEEAGEHEVVNRYELTAAGGCRSRTARRTSTFRLARGLD